MTLDKVQPRSRLIHDVELRVGGEGRHQAHLLPVSLGIGAAFYKV